MIELILPRESQSGNAMAYSHWRVRVRDKMIWKALIASAIAKKDVKKATGHRRVTITAFRKRRLDDDNLIAGLKHCRDMLVHFGLIIDDDRKNATFIYRDDLAKNSPTKKPCTIITLEDL